MLGTLPCKVTLSSIVKHFTSQSFKCSTILLKLISLLITQTITLFCSISSEFIKKSGPSRKLQFSTKKLHMPRVHVTCATTDE